MIMGIIGWAIACFTFGGYALLIGPWVGVVEIILVIWAILVALLFLLVQQLKGNVLASRVMGSSVNVHSLWVLFAALAATALYGVVAAGGAVPIVAIIAVIGEELAGIRGSAGGEG